MAENEVAALKEALCNQYIIIKKLYIELEEEREASATAATEALSMILRLQREKASEKMEACQYRRMAEEKICHAEESLAILEEIMQLKEMEIASLSYQLHAVNHKLSKMGVNNLDVGIRMSEYPTLSGTSTLSDEKSIGVVVRRNASLPAFRLGLSNEDRPTSPSGQSYWMPLGKSTDHSCKCEMMGLFKESVREGGLSNSKKEVTPILLSESAEDEISSESVSMRKEHQTASSVEEGSSICSWFSAVSALTSYDSTIEATGMPLGSENVSCLPSREEDPESTSGCAKVSCSCPEDESKDNSVHSFRIHSPKIHKCCLIEHRRQVLEDSFFDSKNIIRMPDFSPHEAADYFCSDDGWLNKRDAYMHPGNKVSIPRQSVNHGGKLSIQGKEVPMHNGGNMSSPIKGASTGYHGNMVHSALVIDTSQTGFEQIKLKLQHIEDEQGIMHEDLERSPERLNLLREIYEQLHTIESHLKQSRIKRCPPEDESLVYVMEAVLSFSI